MNSYHCNYPSACDTPKKLCRCGCRKKRTDFYAQFGVLANPPSNTDLPLSVLFQEGEQIRLNDTQEILLSAGYLYLIDFLFLATTEPNGYIQITPRINNTLRPLYSFFAPANSVERNTSASGSFTTNEAAAADAVLSFYLTYPNTAQNIDISGAVSVTPLQVIR